MRTNTATAPASLTERRLVRGPEGGPFGLAELDGLPEPVCRHLAAVIAPGTPLARTAYLRMHGTIRIGRWLPFRADEQLTPLDGFVWTARAAGVVTGSDRCLGGTGVADWRLAGLVPVMHAAGPDVSRSAAGRAGGEGVWVPTALLGGEVTDHRTFDGATIPSAGRIGWFFGTDRWPAGEFFRFEISDLHLVREAGVPRQEPA